MKIRKTIKRNLKTDIIAAVFIVIAILGIWNALPLLLEPKTPATVEQVVGVLVSQGYTPHDMTEIFIEKNPVAEETLNKLIIVEDGDMRFEFYDFTDSGHATEIYTNNYSNIIRKYNSFPRVQYRNQRANFSIYTLQASGVYAVTIYVGSTAVYAYADADSEHAVNIRRVLTEIGYLEQGTDLSSGKEKWLHILIRAVCCLILIVMTRICYRWLRRLASQSPESENSNKFSTMYKVLNIPSYLCVILTIIACFTNTLNQVLDYTMMISIAVIIVFPVIRRIFNKN